MYSHSYFCMLFFGVHDDSLVKASPILPERDLGSNYTISKLTIPGKISMCKTSHCDEMEVV